jgi:hypothetical protein
VKTPYRNAAVFAVVLLAALQAAAQLPRDPEERAKAIAQIMQTNSRQLTLFDREGKELTVVGARDLYQQPVFAPDAKRLAVIKVDPEKESNDLWVVDVATGKTTRISTSGARESAASPHGRPTAAVSPTSDCGRGRTRCIRNLQTAKGPRNFFIRATHRWY